MPADPSLYLPGLALRSATNSGSVRAGTLAEQAGERVGPQAGVLVERPACRKADGHAHRAAGEGRLRAHRTRCEARRGEHHRRQRGLQQRAARAADGRALQQRSHRNLAIASSGFLSIAGTLQSAAGWPTTSRIAGRASASTPRIRLRKPIGLGVWVSVARPA